MLENWQRSGCSDALRTLQEIRAKADPVPARAVQPGRVVIVDSDQTDWTLAVIQVGVFGGHSYALHHLTCPDHEDEERPAVAALPIEAHLGLQECYICRTRIPEPFYSELLLLV